MHKLYSFLFAAACTVGAYAQDAKQYVLDVNADNARPTFDTSAPKKMRKATEFENFTLEDGQYILGNSTDDAYDNYGSVPYKGDVLVGAVIYSSTYKDLQNCRALGIRFCLPKTEHLEKKQEVKVKCVTLHDHNIDPMLEQAPRQRITDGWNYVEFDEPMELDPEGTFISYTYEQTADNYGICNWPEMASGGFYTYLFNTDAGKWMWSNWSSYYGAVCIQLVVEATVPDYQVRGVEAYSNPVAVGSESKGVVYLQSDSKLAINNLDYSVTIDGKTTTEHRTLTSPVPSGINQIFGLEVGYTVPETVGEYEVTYTLDKVNGEDLAEKAVLKFNQSVLSRIAKRRTVVEEFTGTGCGWCPRGWVGMEYLKEHYPDTFIGIAVHQYNQNDPMYCGRYCNPGFGGAPTCVIDRKSGAVDPYFGSNGGIDKDVESYSSLAPTVDVKVHGTYSDDKKKVNCTANVEFLANTGKYGIAFVLTADDLTGSNYMQTNYYADKTPAEAGALAQMPELTDFCSGGKYGKGAAKLNYNDVLIGSSYSTSGSNLATLSGTKHSAGDIVERNYACSIAASDALLKQLDYDKVYVVALVIDEKGQIANAARARVGDLSGIDTVLAPLASDDDATYNLSGQRVAAPAKGLYIQGGKKIIR